MAIVDSFLSSTLNTVDAVIGHFVETAYTQLIQANEGTISLLFTFYVMWIGYQFLYHHHHFSLSVVVRHMIVMLCVYGLIMNWQLYQLFVYRIFTIEPENIANVLVNSAGTFQSGGSIAQALDNIYLDVLKAASEFLGQVSFSITGLTFVIYALLIFLFGTIMCIFALLLFIYAKMMMALALALGPLFILFILWDATRGLFSAWLNKLVTIALVPIVTSSILVLMLSVIETTLPNMQQPMDHLQFYGIAPFLGLSLATVMLLSQVFRICSALGGGITLENILSGVSFARSGLEKSGVASGARFAGNWVKGQFRNARRPSRGKNDDTQPK